MNERAHLETAATMLDPTLPSTVVSDPHEDRRKYLLETLKGLRQPNLALVREVLIFLLERP